MTRALRVDRHRLDDRTRDLLGKELSAATGSARLDSDRHEAILAGIGAHALSNHLPGEILRSCRVFPETGAHAMLLSNLPRQVFPESPITGFADETGLAVTNALHFGLLQLLELTPFAVDYENDGRLIRNVVPNPGAAGTTSSWGSDSEFFWHTDNPHLRFGSRGTDPREYVPRYLSFYAIRNEEQVPTEIIAVDDVVEALGEQVRHKLRSTSYRVGTPASTDRSMVLADTPVLELSQQGHLVRYDQGSTAGGDPESATTLDTLAGTLAGAWDRSQALTLAPGDFLIFDNYRVLHRRTAFRPGPAATARWLRRCYAS